MKISIRSILYPTDFSEPAKEAQLYAMSLAEHFDAELHLLHIVSPAVPTSDFAIPWIDSENDSRQRVEEVGKLLDCEIDPNWTQKHHIERVVEVGYAIDEIIKYANNHDIDLIVVGTHGYKGLSHLLLGSMAEKLVRLANCPVLTVHPKGHQFVVDEAEEHSATFHS